MNNFGNKLTKAYVYHSGLTKVSSDAVLNFKRAYKELGATSRTDLEGIISEHLPAVIEEVNPVVNIDEVFKCISSEDMELKNLKIAFHKNPARMTDVFTILEHYPFKDIRNKTKLETSLKMVYGQELPGIEPPTVPQPDTHYKEQDVQQNIPAGDNEAAKLTEDILSTMDSILVNNIFKSKLVPQVEIKGMKKVKRGYVVDLCFKALADENIKLYASAVVLTEGAKRKMMPPVVLYDPNGQELGAFEKETFDRAFTLQTVPAAGGVGDYQKELNQLLDTTTPVQANVVLNRIINKFGTDQAHRAFMTYSQRGIMKGKPSTNETYTRTIFKEAK